MARINFKYRSKNPTSTLWIEFSHKAQRIRVSSSIESKKEYWYNSKGKHRKLGELSNGSADAKAHKKYLEDVADHLIIECINQSNAGVPITDDWLKYEVKKKTKILNNPEEIKSEADRLKKIEEDKSNEQKEIENLNLVTTAITTIRNAKYLSNKHESSKFNVLRELIEEYNPELKIKDVNAMFADNFQRWATEDKKYSLNSIISFIKRVRRAIHYVYTNDEENVIQVSKSYNTFQLPKLKNEKKNKIVITLSSEELIKIDFTNVPNELLNAKKVILFGNEIGIRYSDYNQLTEDNLRKSKKGSEYWEFYSQKTDSLQQVPKTDRVKYLISKYGNPKTDYKENDNVQLNKDLKEVCRMSGITQLVRGSKSVSVKIGEETVRRSEVKLYPKCELIGTHSMRRGYATHMYGKIPNSWIRQVTGHKSDAELETYVNMAASQNIDDIINQTNRIDKEKYKGGLKIIKGGITGTNN